MAARVALGAAQLKSGEVAVDLDAGIAVLRVGKTVWHPARTLVDDFALVFKIPPSLLLAAEDSIRVNESDQERLQQVLAANVRSKVLRPCRRFHTATAHTITAPFKRLQAEWRIALECMPALASDSDARALLASWRSFDAPPLVAWVHADRIKDTSDNNNNPAANTTQGPPHFLGQFFMNTSSPSLSSEAYSVLSVANLGTRPESLWQSLGAAGSAELHAHLPPMLEKTQIGPVAVDALYELLGQVNDLGESVGADVIERTRARMGGIESQTSADPTVIPSALMFSMISWNLAGKVSVVRPLSTAPVVPKRCVVCVGGSPITETAAGEDWLQLDRTLDFLEALAISSLSTNNSDTSPTTAFSGMGMSADEEHDWQQRVDAFVHKNSVKAASLEPKRSGGGGSLSSGIAHAGRRADVDFTEQLWCLLECAPSAMFAVGAVRRVLDSVEEGDVMPFIHKNNHTVLGEHIRQAIRLVRERHYGYNNNNNNNNNNTSASTPAADDDPQMAWSVVTERLAPIYNGRPLLSAEARDMLVQLGSWKLERDLLDILGDCAPVTLAAKLLQVPLSPVSNDSSEANRYESKAMLGADCLRCVTGLRDVVQVVCIAHRLQLPADELRKLTVCATQAQATAVAYAKEKKRACSFDERHPLYAVQLTSSAPWLKLTAAGRPALPSPAEWYARAVGPGGNLWAAFLAPSEGSAATFNSKIESGTASPTETNHEWFKENSEDTTAFTCFAGSVTTARMGGR